MPKISMVSHIPLEVIDSCIDCLASDMKDNLDPKCSVRQTLVSCSRVSRSVSHRSRQYLFRRIRLKNKTWFHTKNRHLHEIMKADPQFCSYIRAVEIELDDEVGKVATTASGSRLPEILKMLTDVGPHNKGIHAFRLHGTSNHLSWSKLSSEFLSASLKFIHGNGQSQSNSCETLKSLHISGFQGVPVTVIVNCESSLRDLKIQSLSLVEAPQTGQVAGSTSRTRAAKAKQLLVLNLQPRPGTPAFILDKFHFTGMNRGNTNILSTLMLQKVTFSQLKELEIYPMEPADIKIVCDIVESAKSTLEVLKLERRTTPATELNLEIPDIDFGKLPSLKIVKVVDFIQFYEGPGGLPSLSPLFSLFDSKTKTTTSLEAFELHLSVTAESGMESAIYAREHQWDKLDEDLTSLKFPKMRRVDLKMQIMLFAQGKGERRRAIEEDIEEGFRATLVSLYSSPTIDFNIEVDVVKEWTFSNY